MKFWVQLLKKFKGLADGTREWRNGFLAAARGIGFETSRLGTVCSGTEGLTAKDGDIARGGDEVWEQSFSELKKRFTFGRWEVGKGNSVAERLFKQQMDPCVLDNPSVPRVWISCLSGK